MAAPACQAWGVIPLEEFHAAPTYGGDLHRADMAWAKHAAGCGLTLEQIKAELLNGRDLSKKGSRKRQLEYVERTARKAIEQMRGCLEMLTLASGRLLPPSR